MEIGIIGLPNVGKSTLFNALTSGHAPSSNYPFTTIEPNVGVVLVPDERLRKLTDIFKPKKSVPASVRFVDIAGLVQGASKGEGLGNQFLSHVREVDALLHLVRLFKDPDVVHNMGDVDPRRDIEVIETELILADLESLERQHEKTEPKARSGDKEAKKRLELIAGLRKVLDEGKTARSAGLDPGETKELFLLTDKPVLFVGNADEKQDLEVLKRFEDAARGRGAEYITLTAKIEEELVQLSEADRDEFLRELGLEQTGLERVIHAAYRLLGLWSYFTKQSDEVRAWTIPRGTRAPRAAGIIHTDFEKGFIRADVYRAEDLFSAGSESALRSKGLIRSEGKDYKVQDGDVCLFKFSS